MAFNIKYTYDLVDKLSPQLNKIKANVHKVQSTIKRSSSKIGDNFDHMRHKLNRFGSRVKEVGKSLFLKLTLPIGALGFAFVKAASDAEETSSKFATVFKSVSTEAENTANNLAKNFGLSSIKAKELLGDTGDLLTGFGFTGKAALDLARDTNKLAVDLASFTNFSGGAEGASKALTKALLGERESVKSLGISILEEDVKAKIKSLAATGKLTGMTERQAKAYATLQIAISQSKNAIGDYARTSESFANKTRELNARFFDLKVTLGNIILPLALKLVKLTIRLIEKFEKLSPAVKKIILIVGGLVGVLSPLLIMIGFMIPAITSLAVVFKVLFALMVANPIGLIITAISALVAGVIILRNKLKALGFSLSDIPRLALDSFQRSFPKIFGFFDSLIGKARAVFSFVQKGINLVRGSKGSAFADQEISKTFNANINQKQSPLSIGGELGININGLPKGSSTSFTPIADNKLPVGVNAVFAGG